MPDICWLCGKEIEFALRDANRARYYVYFGEQEANLVMHLDCSDRVVKANMPKGRLLRIKYARLDAVWQRFKNVEGGLSDEQHAEHERLECAMFDAEHLVLKIVYYHRLGYGVRKIAKELGTDRNRVFRVIRSVHSLENNVSNAEMV
jgi:hypothetical protein